MTYIFIPPTVKEGPMGGNYLFARYGMNRGISVLKINGNFYEVRTPSTDEVKSADAFYQGGYENIVSLQEKLDLEAAGYEVITT